MSASSPTSKSRFSCSTTLTQLRSRVNSPANQETKSIQINKRSECSAWAPKSAPLTLQLNLDDLERLLAGIFRQVSKGIHVHHRPSFRFDVLTLPVRVGELRVSVRQKHSNGFGMAVHHRFLARFVLDPDHSHSIILEFDCVVLGINFHRVVGSWLRHSCSCHVLLLSI